MIKVLIVLPFHFIQPPPGRKFCAPIKEENDKVIDLM